jgi:lysozyme family protein
MAKIDKMIPYLLRVEAYGAKSCWVYKTVGTRRVRVAYDPSRASLEQQYAECKTQGLSNDKDDRGGLTMCGVTYATYAVYCRKKNIDATEKGLKALSYAQWREILKTMYWDRCKGDDINSQGVANMIVDWYWISGITGSKRVQAIVGAKVDGIIGPKTVAAINAMDEKELFAKIKAARLAHFDEIVRRTPSQAKYLEGWRKRVGRIDLDGFNLL